MRAYTERQIQALEDLNGQVKAIYDADTTSGREQALRHAMYYLDRIAWSFGIDPNGLAPSKPEPMGPVGPAYENDTFEILHVCAPRSVRFYQKFDVTLRLHNTGKWTWKDRVVVMSKPNENGPTGQLVELPVVAPGGTCQVTIPMNAEGVEGDFTLHFDILGTSSNIKKNMMKLYDESIHVPIHVGFDKNLFN